MEQRGRGSVDIHYPEQLKTASRNRMDHVISVLREVVLIDSNCGLEESKREFLTTEKSSKYPMPSKCGIRK